MMHSTFSTYKTSTNAPAKTVDCRLLKLSIFEHIEAQVVLIRGDFFSILPLYLIFL